MSERTRTINVHPYHLESAPTEEGFKWEFHCTTPGEGKVVVRMHFPFWWARFIARHLWKAIASRRESVANAERALKEEGHA